MMDSKGREDGGELEEYGRGDVGMWEGWGKEDAVERCLPMRSETTPP